MASLLQQLANSVMVICNCDFKPEYFTNGRWICNPATPNVVRLRADVAGTGVVPSTTLASDVNRWAQTTTTSLSVAGDNLAVTGSETCTNRDCTTKVPTTQGNALIIVKTGCAGYTQEKDFLEITRDYWRLLEITVSGY